MRRPYDGISLLPLLDGELQSRPHRIGFQSDTQVAMVDNRHKLYRADTDRPVELYDLCDDPSETCDIAARHAGIVTEWWGELNAWRESCAASARGEDYPRG